MSFGCNFGLILILVTVLKDLGCIWSAINVVEISQFHRNILRGV